MRAARARVVALVVTLASLGAACADDVSSPVATPEPIATAPIATTRTATTPTSTASGATLPTCRGDDARLDVGRTDIRPSGNRVAPGTIDLLRAPMASVDLPAAGTWVVPFYVAEEPCAPHWYVTLETGIAVIVGPDGELVEMGEAVEPPETSTAGIRNAHTDLDQFDNPLPDSRVVSFGQWTAALVEPTDRYGHGVLGDRIEASAVQVINTDTGSRTLISVDPPAVIEGISPMLIDVDLDDPDNAAVPEVLVTVSDAALGAALVLYNIDGTVRAESPAIGRGNRWRNQLGVGWFGLNPSYEIVDVRTPHLDGVVEFFRIVDDQLERVATITGYTTHVLGSRNLDLGILVDADGDKLVEVVLPTRDLASLAIIDRVADGAVEIGRIELGARQHTNIAAQWLGGQALLALGTSDGRLIIFG